MGITADEDICRGGHGLFLPLFESEADLPWFIQAVMYGFALLWCFTGVALIADVFMGAIERVTSKKKLKRIGNKQVTVKVWNDTVANLTLMALGSSAPEILLSLIELMGMNNFYSGQLGPSTIVGSAAFNLLVITAVCVCCIPADENGRPGVRIIKDTNVFAVTATFSILAYLWVLFIVMGTSKDVVSIAEGLITFLLFFVLVGLAYLVDVGTIACLKREGGQGDKVFWSEVTHEQLADMEHKIRERYNADLTHEQVMALLHYEFKEQPSRAKYRVAATRNLFKGKKVHTNETEKIGKQLTDDLKRKSKQEQEKHGDPQEVTHFFFPCLEHTVLESVGSVAITVAREGGDLSKPVTVGYRTRDGTASAGSDYDGKGGHLEFEPHMTSKVILIRIIDDDTHEDTEDFNVDLVEPEFLVGEGKAALKKEASTTTVVIVDDDLPGDLSFKNEQEHIEQAMSPEPFTRSIKVLRKNGGCGKISCSYETEDDDAVHGYDYQETAGRLEFEDGQMEATIQVKILPRGRYDNTAIFRLILKDPEGTEFDPTTDGGKHTCICTVFIKPNEANKDRVDSLRDLIRINHDKMQIGNDNYWEQFTAAIYCGGSAEAQKDSSWKEYLHHIVVFPWKIFCAVVPPTDYCGGWVAFWCSLFAIAIVAALIGDLANLFGCSIHLRKMTTAITIVALGTSLPDTFASKTAAIQDPYADASVGNVTGSNSVNVFLGLGFPWLIGAIYWRVNGATGEWIDTYRSRDDTRHVVEEYDRTGECSFVVPKVGLDVSVLVFSVCAVISLGFLEFRRYKYGGELGGPTTPAYLSAAFLIFLWLIYIVISIVIDYSSDEE
jgi:solute carrier family 8 (sodium/calcium exchanger)